MKYKSLLFTLLAAPLFMWSCGEKSSTVVTDEGLEITDLESGSGPEAKVSDYVTLHFTGFLENGDEFESSYNHGQPITIQAGIGQLPIRGWDEGIIGMREGGKRSLVIPPDLAFGEHGIEGIIPGNETIRIDVELLSIVTPPEPWDYDEEDIASMESGLQYVIHEEGDGDKPEEGDIISVHYAGFLEDGTLFDSSHLRDQAFEFQVGVGQVIQGWDQGLMDMKVGEKRTLIIPAELGYGSEGAGGAIPPNSVLIFDVELLGIH